LISDKSKALSAETTEFVSIKNSLCKFRPAAKTSSSIGVPTIAPQSPLNRQDTSPEKMSKINRIK